MIKMKSLLEEKNMAGKTFISVDIQPEYERGFTFDMKDFSKFLNELECHDIIFLFNGPDMGFPDEEEYKMWLHENGVSGEVLDNATFYDKGYAFFRYCMDNSLEDDVIANFVRFMYENDIRDSRDMNRDMWAKYLRLHRRTDKKEVYELLRDTGDCVNIPDLMDFLKRLNNIVLTGGGVNECLKEVEIALKALKKPYEMYDTFIY